EAEAILLACDDLDAVMETIHGAETPVEARRALKCGFGFTGRQAALLLTLPVLSFTRSERERMHASRRARMDLWAAVTRAIPVVPPTSPPPPAAPPVPAAPVAACGGRAGRRSSDRSEEAGAVLDEQIGELCDAIAELVEVDAPASPLLDDPRDSMSPTGQLLD